MSTEIEKFYGSAKWKQISRTAKSQRNYTCDYCHKSFPQEELETHHIIPLTIANLNNPNITFNFKNLAVLCHECHNKQHHRFNVNKGKVYLVHGAPCSGKTTFVRERATKEDLVVDFDYLLDAITNKESLHDSNTPIRKITYEVRDYLYDLIKTKRHLFHNAFVIGCLPTKRERENVKRKIGDCEVVHIDVNKNKCLEQLYKRETNLSIINQYSSIINQYFEGFERDTPPIDSTLDEA